MALYIQYLGYYCRIGHTFVVGRMGMQQSIAGVKETEKG